MCKHIPLGTQYTKISNMHTLSSDQDLKKGMYMFSMFISLVNTQVYLCIQLEQCL
jgi:hypothetical protein